MATKLPKLQGSEERENKNCSNQVTKNGREKKIVATKMPKTWGEINSNLGNEVAKNEGGKKKKI